MCSALSGLRNSYQKIFHIVLYQFGKNRRKQKKTTHSVTPQERDRVSAIKSRATEKKEREFRDELRNQKIN